jgi:hypothetical protein
VLKIFGASLKESGYCFCIQVLLFIGKVLVSVTVKVLNNCAKEMTNRVHTQVCEVSTSMWKTTVIMMIHITQENGNHSDIHDGNILGLGTKRMMPALESAIVKSIQRKVEYYKYTTANPMSASSAAALHATYKKKFMDVLAVFFTHQTEISCLTSVIVWI